MAEPLAFPEFPPDGPWSAYVLLIIWVPLILRILFLIFPFRRAINKLAPHTGWAIKQLRELPVRGFGILAINEILAFVIPPVLVLMIRFLVDPIGWQSWDEASVLGIVLLSMFVIVWIVFDMLRIFRVRRMLKAIDRYDVDKLRKIADAGLGVRGWLRKFAGKDKQEQPEPTTNRLAKRSAKIWAGRALMAGRLTPQGLLGSLAIGAALEAAKTGAGKISDRIDQKMQEEFDKIAQVNSKTLLSLLIRDFAMGVLPLVALAMLPIFL
jgi:hypothetical protein